MTRTFESNEWIYGILWNKQDGCVKNFLRIFKLIFQNMQTSYRKDDAPSPKSLDLYIY